ncbi:MULTISPECIES: hypothetical protein [unclassified Xanthobacter]|uniref:hypothetical protein n=1 Tax=unclassified Xanthobacter TaxID=2623496 RepID=UPI001F170BDB|nr:MULTISPECIES: hypothetical protein [unclassified Xanthobacter]
MSDDEILICEGRFQVWDRGDRIAEVSTVGGVEVTTAEFAEAVRRQDAIFDREHIPLQVGKAVPCNPIVAIVQAVPAHTSDGYSDSDLGSAFPGMLQLRGGALLDGRDEHPVADMEQLAALLRKVTWPTLSERELN